jgi:hypothetical protein
MFALALAYDALNVAWGLRAAQGRGYRSPIAVVPAVLYVASVLLVSAHLSLAEGAALCFALVVLHVGCWQLLPLLFEKLCSRSEGSQRDEP